MLFLIQQPRKMQFMPIKTRRNIPWQTMLRLQVIKERRRLCVFLGMFGAHQYYVGKIGKGILYTCTFGLFGIGWIVDIFKIALGNFRDNTGAPLRQ